MRRRSCYKHKIFRLVVSWLRLCWSFLCKWEIFQNGIQRAADRQRRWKTSFHTEILSVRSTIRIKRFFDLVGRSVHLNFCLGALMDLSLTPVSQDSYWMTHRWSEKHWASLKIPNSWFSQVTSAIIQRYSYNTGNTETQAAKWPVTYTCEYSL